MANLNSSAGKLQPRLGSQYKSGLGDLGTGNRQLLLGKGSKPPKELPALDAHTRYRINQSLNQSAIENSKMLGGPPSMIYAGFEGGVSISQKNLENARSKWLVDKLTGKIPHEPRGGQGQILPPINKDSPRNKKSGKSKASHISGISKSRVDEQELKAESNSKDKI